MGNKYRQPPSDLIRSQLDVIDRLSTLESTPRAPATTVDNGVWRFLQGTGQEVVRYGALGGGVIGWMFRRGSNGTPALYLGGTPSNEYFALSDNAGNILFSDNTDVTGAGIARPYIPYPAVKITAITASDFSTTSTSAVAAAVVLGYRQHPIVVTQYFVSTPVGVSAEVQLVDTTSDDVATQYIIDSQIHAGNSNTFATLSGNLNSVMWTPFYMDLRIRVSAGAGTVGISHLSSYGVQA